MHTFDMRVPFWIIRLYNSKGDTVLVTWKGYGEASKETEIERIKATWGMNAPFTVQEGWE